MNRTLGILLSGRGSNFLAIHEHICEKRLDAAIACVISDQENAPGLMRARDLGISTAFISPKKRPKAAFETEMADFLDHHTVGLVCLAGFMRILGPDFIRRFPQRILNIHPSLLPSFPGLNAQEQAWRHGVKVSGCTVHLVDEGMDTGPILAQAAVPVLDSDTPHDLAERILVQEHRLYAAAISCYLNGCTRSDRRLMFAENA